MGSPIILVWLMAWVAASFIIHLGLTLEQTKVRLLAYLGDWKNVKIGHLGNKF